MGLFRRNSADDTERLPAFIPTECIGELCPNYTGEKCDNTEMEWLSAGGPTRGRDTSKPPLRSEATYIIYGQRCLAGAQAELVAQRVEIHQPREVNLMKIIALAGRYGDTPLIIVDDARRLNVTS